MKVFVTGGHGGIGSAVCEKFARDGRFDAVVHCAGYNPPLSVEDTTIEEFDRTQNINLTSLLEITRAVAPYMKEQKRGRIVGIASLYATISRENRVSYACSKHGLVGLIKTLALELGQFGVLCNTVSPGYVDTAMFRSRNDAEKRAFIVDGGFMAGSFQ